LIILDIVGIAQRHSMRVNYWKSSLFRLKQRTVRIWKRTRQSKNKQHTNKKKK
jgi:hypothetical protein